APLRRPRDDAVHVRGTLHAGVRASNPAAIGARRICTLIEHYNPLRYWYLKGCLCCPGLANLAPHVDAFQSNSMRREASRMTAPSPDALAVIEGRHADPFRYLGPHLENGVPIVRVFLPDAQHVFVIGARGEERPLDRIHDAGLFVGCRPDDSRSY